MAQSLKLEKHISLGNYKYIQKIKDSCVVASFFKNIFKTMFEPLCKFSLYEKFKTISNTYSSSDRDEKKLIRDLNEVFLSMEKIY